MGLLLEASLVDGVGKHPVLPIILALLSGLLLWRLWKFTIVSYLWPCEPKELPYWIPFLGHTWRFLYDTHDLLTSASGHFNNNQEPFAITVGGKRFVIITDFQDVTTLWRNTKLFHYKQFVQNILCTFGLPRVSVHRMYQDVGAFAQEGTQHSLLQTDNPLNKCINDLQVDWLKRQVTPGRKLDAVQEIFMGCINKSLRWNKFGREYVLSTMNNKKKLSLFQWCAYTLVDASTRAFFGESIFKVNPGITNDFFVFEETSWKILLGYPRLLAKDMHSAKKSLVETFAAYYSLPLVDRSDSSWFFERQGGEMKHLGFDVKDVASIAALYYWVINANAHKICFWMLAHMLFHLDLLTAVRAETAPACSPDGTFNMNHLLTSCPHLDGIWHEVLRVYNNVAVVREVTSPTMLGGKNLRRGDTMLSPFRQFNLDRNVYGDDVLNFRHDRFLEGKLTTGTKTFRPFGGGHTHCPGRFLARREVYVFVALAINRFNIHLDSINGPQAFPKPDQRKPNLGAMAPIDGYDLIVNVTPKQLASQSHIERKD